MEGNILIVGGFVIAAFGGWLNYCLGGSFMAALALTFFVLGNIFLVLK